MHCALLELTLAHLCTDLMVPRRGCGICLNSVSNTLFILVENSGTSLNVHVMGPTSHGVAAVFVVGYTVCFVHFFSELFSLLRPSWAVMHCHGS